MGEDGLRYSLSGVLSHPQGSLEAGVTLQGCVGPATTLHYFILWYVLIIEF